MVDVVATNKKTPVYQGIKLKDNSWDWGHLGQRMIFFLIRICYILTGVLRRELMVVFLIPSLLSDRGHEFS